MESIEQKIANISAKQKADRWAARQESARQQQAETERQRVERYRTQRIAAIKSQLDGLPARIKNATALASDADQLASVWAAHIDGLANEYAQRIHAERQGGRSIRLDLASPEAQAYFFGSTLKKSLRQLSITASQRSFGQPLLDAESLAAELHEEEKALRAELAELQLRG